MESDGRDESINNVTFTSSFSNSNNDEQNKRFVFVNSNTKAYSIGIDYSQFLYYEYTYFLMSIKSAKTYTIIAGSS